LIAASSDTLVEETGTDRCCFETVAIEILLLVRVFNWMSEKIRSSRTKQIACTRSSWEDELGKLWLC